jgi:MEMO1 family protein
MDGEERPPAVAGMFYPADPARLTATVDGLLAAAGAGMDGPRPGALLVPHAGYRYSGPVAAAAYVHLRRTVPALVVLVGPAHYVRVAGSAVPRAAEWRTPLGAVAIDPAARDAALRVAGVRADDEPHAPEHSLEVQLPFLQRVSGGDPPPVLPVVTHAAADAVADLLDAVAADPGTLVLASTDLTHHVPDAVARERDARTAEAILDLAPDRVDDRAACGAHALRGLLAWAARHGLRPSRLAQATSADTGGDPASVVGYAAFAFG